MRTQSRLDSGRLATTRLFRARLEANPAIPQVSLALGEGVSAPQVVAVDDTETVFDGIPAAAFTPTPTWRVINDAADFPLYAIIDANLNSGGNDPVILVVEDGLTSLTVAAAAGGIEISATEVTAANGGPRLVPLPNGSYPVYIGGVLDDTVVVSASTGGPPATTAATGLTADDILAMQARVGSAKGLTLTTSMGQRSVAAAGASAPDAMGAPTVTPVLNANGQQLEVDTAGAPANGGSTILSYDLQYRVGAGSWTLVEGITLSDYILSLLVPDTAHEVQTRAVNAIDAGPWSPSGFGTTTVAAPVWSETTLTPISLPRGVAMTPVDLMPLIDLSEVDTVVVGPDFDVLPAGLIIEEYASGMFQLSGTPTERTSDVEPLEVQLVFSNDGGPFETNTDNGNFSLEVTAPVHTGVVASPTGVSFDTSIPNGDVYWVLSTDDATIPEDEIIAGVGASDIDEVGTFEITSGVGSTTFDFSAYDGLSGYLHWVQVADDGSISEPTVVFFDNITAPATLTEPTLLATYTTSATSSNHQVNFTPPGDGPVVVKVHMMNGASASAQVVVSSAQIGPLAMTTGTGTDADNSGIDNNSRNNTAIYVFKDPGSSEIKFEIECSSLRACYIEVWEYPGDVGPAAVQDGDVDTDSSSASSRTTSIVPSSSDSWIALACCVRREEITMDWDAGVDANGAQSAQHDTNPSGTNTNDLMAMTAYRQAAADNPVVSTCSWTGSFSSASVAIEIKPLIVALLLLTDPDGSTLIDEDGTDYIQET